MRLDVVAVVVGPIDLLNLLFGHYLVVLSHLSPPLTPLDGGYQESSTFHSKNTRVVGCLPREGAAGTSVGLCALLRPGLPEPKHPPNRGCVGGFDHAHWAYGIALAVFAYRDGGAAAVGLVGLVRFLPSAVASPFTALLGDRYRRERVIVVAELTRAVLLAIDDAIVVVAHRPPSSTSSQGSWPSRTPPCARRRPRSFPPLQRRRRSSPPPTSPRAPSRALASLGSAIGGLLLAATGEAVVFGAAAAAFLLSAILIGRVRVDAQPEPRERRGRVFREFTAGFVTLYRERGLRVLVFLLASQTFVAGMLNVLIVVIALRLLDLGEEGVGFLNSAIGIGGLVGAVVAAALIGRRLSSNFLLGIGLWGIPIALIGVFPETAPTLLFLAFVGLGNTLVDVSAFTLLQRAVPEEVLARAFGAVQALWVAAIGIGSIAAPLLIAAADIRGALLITARSCRPSRYSCAAGSPSWTRCPSLSGSSSCSAASSCSRRCRSRRRKVSRRCSARFGWPRGGALQTGRRRRPLLHRRRRRGGDRHRRTCRPRNGSGRLFRRDFAPARRSAHGHGAGEGRCRALDRDDFIAAVTGHAASAEVADSVIATRLGSIRPGMASV